MANLTAPRPYLQRGLRRFYVNMPLYAGKCYAGGLAGISAAGNVAPVDATYTKAIGIFTATKDNTGGAAGDVKVDIERGEFFFDNDATNALTKAHLAGLITPEWTDDHTAANTASASTVTGGKVTEVCAVNAGNNQDAGVWVEFD